MRSEEVGNGGGSGGTDDDVRGSGHDASPVGVVESGGGIIEVLLAHSPVVLLVSAAKCFVVFVTLIAKSGGGGASLEGLRHLRDIPYSSCVDVPPPLCEDNGGKDGSNNVFHE